MNNLNKTLLLISYDFPPSDGGIARLVTEIANGMTTYFDTVTVLTLAKKGISRPYMHKKIKVIELPSKRIKAEIEAIKFLKRIQNKENYTVLTGVWHPEVFLLKAAGFKNINVLGHGTEYLYGKSFFRKYFWLKIYAKNILKNTHIITNSHFTESIVQKNVGKLKTTPLPLPVNQEFFRPMSFEKENGKLKIATVSRILQFKGHDFIAKTIAQLPEKYKNKIQWNIAGTGAYKNELENLVKELKIENVVQFHGFVPDEDLPAFYNQNDLFLLCTREAKNSTEVEGFGLVFLEAQACGLPVIGTNTGGISDAVKHENGGWLIQQDNVNELKKRLVFLIDNPAELRIQSKKAHARVEQEATREKYCAKLVKFLC